MYKHFISSLSAAIISLGLLSFSVISSAEEKKQNIEDMVEKPTEAAATDLGLSETKRARLTEEQALMQLKFMMVEGWKRNEGDLLDRGSFKPMGMTLDPDGTFRAVYVDGQAEMPKQVAVTSLVRTLKELAANRTQWAVGIMYVTADQKADGTFARRIVVFAEHIAGWAYSWNYPYKTVEGELKLGKAIEKPEKPVYYTR